jgi:heme/copper-type cytochrome/quinol oxidase subunit 4
MTAEITGTIFLLLALISFAASLVFFLGVGGKRNLRSQLTGAGFALLAAAFAWLWLG